MSFVQYKNGNYTVYFNTDTGTKIRTNDLDFLKADFPESFDCKITNKCCNNCNFCHENSTFDGKHGNILANSFIDNLHPYTEIAIGGGNPLEHPDLIKFLYKLKELKVIPSMTIRQTDFLANIGLLRDLCDKKLLYGLGISLVDANDTDFISAVKEFTNAVIHVINGIVTAEQLKLLANNNLKILILGYKEVRRGKTLLTVQSENETITRNKVQLFNLLEDILGQQWFNVVSFDNLAIKQLNPKRFLSDNLWNEMFMGDDGIDGQMTSASMFVDMVEGTFAKNSCDLERHKLLATIDDMFSVLVNEI